jgi:hypothetical protein
MQGARPRLQRPGQVPQDGAVGGHRGDRGVDRLDDEIGIGLPHALGHQLEALAR